MTEPNLWTRTLEALVQLAREAATSEAAADELADLRAIADASGSMFAPAVRLIANSHRIHAMELRSRVTSLALELARASGNLDQAAGPD